MASQARLIFVNLAVRDVRASMDFFGKLGFEFDERFTDDSAACLIVNEQAYVMLVTQSRFAEFVSKPVADAHAATEAIVGLSADSREDVDRLHEAALAAGAGPGAEPMDHGFMYVRSFHDLDGHLWEAVWMSPEAIEGAPAAVAGEQG